MRDRDRHAGVALSESQLVQHCRTKRRAGGGREAGSGGGSAAAGANAGCEVFICEGESADARLDSLLDELGRRRMTNVLVEGRRAAAGQFV